MPCYLTVCLCYIEYMCFSYLKTLQTVLLLCILIWTILCYSQHNRLWDSGGRMGTWCYSLHPAVWLPPISQSGSGPGRTVPANKTRTTPLPAPLLGPHLRGWGVQKYTVWWLKCPYIHTYTHTRLNRSNKNLYVILLCVCLCLRAEARCLVRALLQSDPTVRLTAEQTLLHPWVKAMASICRQRALTDKSEKNTVDAGAEPERVQRAAQINAAEVTSSEGVFTHKVELSRHNERQAKMSKEVDKPPQQLSTETSIVQSISPQIKANTPSQQKSECTSTDSGSPRRRVIQHSGLNLSNTDCDSISQLNAPEAQTEPPSLIETHQSTQNSLHQTPNLQPPTNAEPRTTVGHSTQHQPFSHPAATSSTHPLHQQSFTSPLHNPTTATAQNHLAENHDELTTDITINHPPAQSQPHWPSPAWLCD